MPASPSHFDVEQFRHETQRLAVARTVTGPTLVLGSTQPVDVIDADVMRERGVALARRRGGGGAVYLGPGQQLWLDVWIPRDDPLWVRDVSAAAVWVGRWWTAALAGMGQHGFDVQRGRSVPGDLGGLVCFAGRGPGEVFVGARKVVGLSQWRAREGALFSSCAYLRWDPAPLLALLNVDEEARAGLARQLENQAVGLAELASPLADVDVDVDGVRAWLLESLPAFSVSGPPGT